MGLTLTADVRQEIERIDRAFEACFANGDATGMAKHYTTDAIIFPPGSDMVQGRDAIGAYWKALMDALPGARVTLQTTDVESSGDLAVESGHALITGADGSTIDTAKYLVVWKEEHGVWKLHRDAWNSNVAPKE